MKKIGVVSLFEGQNFGNKLQNYAVEQIIREYGFEPYTFKYELNKSKRFDEPSTIAKFKPSYILAFVKSILSNRFNVKNSDKSKLTQLLFWYKHKVELSNKFQERVNKYYIFDYKNLNFAQRIIKFDEINSSWANEYSMFLAGSDQVWNPYYSFVSSNNFLQFAPKEKRASIAASFGVSELPPQRVENYTKWLSSFEYLSVREEAGQKLIKDLTGVDATVIPDPTIIVGKKIWNELANKPNFDVPKKYLLTYVLGDRTKKYGSYIKKMAKKYDLEIVNLLDILQPQYLTCDPAEFVYLIQNAELICTDSFHACVFSILYHKPFVVFDRVEGKRKMGSRINTLLGSVDMMDRKFENISKNPIEIDYSTIDEKIENLRNNARGYLEKVFVAANENEVSIDTTFNVYNTDDCTGCMACVDGCPKIALSIEMRNGYNYPTLNESLCINCGKCERVCPVFNSKELPTPKKAYAMKIKDDEILKGSSSGGVVTAISKEVISAGGVVVGAAFDDDFNVKHIVVDNDAELSMIRKTKYVQSTLLDAYAQINDALKENKKVLFTGTPCQVAAIKSYFGEQENLLLVAIICHGVPSPKLWREHIDELQRVHNSKLNAVDFRDKSNGWKNYMMKFSFENGEKMIISPNSDSYMQAFYGNKLRPSCTNCHFKGGNSGADITIGDFWGFNILSPELDDNTGMSVVTLHSNIGEKLVKNDNVDIVKEYDCFTAMGQNPSYFYSS